MELNELTLTSAVKQIKNRQLSPMELAQDYLECIARRNPVLNCFITVNLETVLADARRAGTLAADRPQRYPLLGAPLAIKDLYETAGILTTAGARIFSDNVPKEDARVVQKLKSAGMVLLGKLNMHEIALGLTNVNPHYGACHNPWNLSRVSGGSSGGSAAALAADLCLGSMGTDTGGSIRVPAALCGVVGFKPTFGRVSCRGVIPLSWNLDHPGPLGRCVEDVALLLQVVAGYDAADPFCVKRPVDDYLRRIKDGVQGWRVALASDEHFTHADPQVREAVSQAAQVFAQLGAKVETVPFPDGATAAQANSLLVTADGAAFHAERLRSQPEDFGEDVRQRLRNGAACSTQDYILARRTQVTLRRRFESFFTKYDILITPTTPITAPPIEGSDTIEQARLLTRFTSPFNLTGLPALSLPCGFDREGLPIGLQIVARPWAEASVLRAAYAYEQATSWHKRRPELPSV